MHKLLFTLVFLLTGLLTVSASEPDITGVWLVGDKDYKIELTRNNAGEIEGRVVWMLEPLDKKTGKPLTDVDNDDPALRSRPVMGLKVVWGFKWDAAAKEFLNGKVYKKGTTYCGKMHLGEGNKLHLRGYVCKVKFLGKSDTWTRSKL